MLVMGMPHGFRLIMPRVLALAHRHAAAGDLDRRHGAAGRHRRGQARTELVAAYFFRKLPSAVPLANYWIGLGKGVVFGMLIALVACHFGLRIKPNTESLGRGTTTSVVIAITAVILADAVFAILFSGVGF
jgi:phospholipid/cholesterol/gamma-HCH transport system permease protein